MRQEQLYQPQPRTPVIQRPQLNPIIASGSPKNLNLQTGIQVEPRILNAVFSHHPSTLNPESTAAKPLSTPLYGSVQSPKVIGQGIRVYGGRTGQAIGAINARIGTGQAAQNVIMENSGESRQSVQSVFGTKTIPTRPNYHFFGTDSRQDVSRSRSPPSQASQLRQDLPRSISPPQGQQNSRHEYSRNVVPGPQIQNQNINSRSHSHSPLSVHSDSSQRNRMLHRVYFSYNNPSFASTTHVIQHVSHVTHQQGGLGEQFSGMYGQHGGQLGQLGQIAQIGQIGQIGQAGQFGQQGQQGQLSQQGQIGQLGQQGQIGQLGQQGVQTQTIQQFQPQPLQPQPQPIYQTNHQTIITTTTIVWQHRFVEIYSKFEIFVQKFEAIIEQIYNIDDLFDNVNDQEAWNDLRVRYTDMIQNFNNMRDEIIGVLEQNKTAINSLSPEVVREISEKQIAEQKEHQERGNEEPHQEYEEEHEGHHQEGGETGKSGSQNNNHVWQNRCLELMQQHELLTKENNQMKQQIERLRMEEHQNEQSPEKRPREGENQSSKVVELQRNINTIHSEYQKLQENYNKLSNEYTRVVSQYQNQGNSSSNEYQQELAQMEQQLEMAQSKINELYEQLQNKNEHLDQYEKQIEGYGQILEQNKALMETVNKMHTDLDAYELEFKNKEKTIETYTHEINNLHEQLAHSAHAGQAIDSVKAEQITKKSREVESLKQQEKNLLNLIEKHEQSIEEMVLKNQRLNIQFEAVVQEKDGQIKLLERFLEEEREAKNRAMNQSYQREQRPVESVIDEKIIKERVQVQVEEAVSEKNRKIRLLTQDLEDLKIQIENLQKDKAKQIKQIKQFFVEEQEKYIKKINEKEVNAKALQEKLKSFQSQLSNRNLEISRFRHQSPVNSFNASNEESRKHTEALDKKNHEIQQLRRTIQQKNISLKELEQKLNSLEQELSNRIFEIGSLKREVNDQHGSRAEIDSLNNTIKKKNQEINELRLSGVELEQLKINIDSLERQKIRLNEYLKEKTRECESKDNTIQSLQRKNHSLSTSMESYGLMKKPSVEGPSQSVIVNYENLLKQKETQIKNLKYQSEMLETKISISQKSIRDLNVKVNNFQKSSSLLKAEMQNKVSRYETDIKGLNKQIKSLKDVRDEFKNLIESLQSKNQSLQKSLDERNTLFDKQITRNKEKVTSIEQINTTLLVDQQLHKNQVDRLVKQNRDLNDKIKALETKVESKNNAISELKGNYNRKQKEDMKFYEQKIKKLDGELKLSSVRLRNMQNEIATLNKKIQHTESEKRSYQSRLINEQSQQKTSFIDFQQAVTSQYDIGNQDILQMDRFKLKDPEANDIFERKVIYELKRENDLLRRELSSVGPSSYSANKYDQINQMSYQQEFFTDRDHESKQNEYNNEIVAFFKNKNKQQENRIDQLLRVNNQLKNRITTMSSASGNQLSIQFYKDQVTKLESQVSELQAKIKKMINDHKSSVDQLMGHQHEADSLKDKVTEQSLKVNELKKTINRHEDTIAQLQNTKAICYAQIERLKQTIDKLKAGNQELSKKDRTIADSNKKQKSLEEEISKLTNKVSIQSAQIDRLNDSIRSRKTELESKFNQNSEESKKLRKRILELERELQILKLEHHNDNNTENAYKIQKIRSFFSEIEALVGEIPINERRVEEVIKQVRHQVQQGFATISMIQI